MTPLEKKPRRYFPLPLQISAKAWENYALSLDLLREVPSSPLYPLRLLAECLQKKSPGHPAGAGYLNVLALLSTIFRFVASRYLEVRHCSIGSAELTIQERTLPFPALSPVLETFVSLYPPTEVLEGADRSEFLSGGQGPANRQAAVVELFLLAVQMNNPGAARAAELFDDTELNHRCAYRDMVTRLDNTLQQEPAPDLLGGSLLELLKAPLKAAPFSLSGQLRYIREHWAGILPAGLLQNILSAFDLLEEEEMQRGGGPGPIPTPRFGRGAADLSYDEPERFSPDWDWMSNVVLLAKTIYVWLDQLTKKYGRPIASLDQIPDEELDLLARRGFSSLWLIGIWERSPASKKIKQIMGNPEAVSSAYSLYDYTVAQDLGGEAALGKLEERCWQRGIRLGCDVVPNHMGIYSKWVKDHPDWFIQRDHPPFPSYRFTGTDLSFDDEIGLQIEDGYWSHSEAGVVFKYIHHPSGRVRYIYHGNDGTHLPWNDTAQLNFLLPEVREAMIQTILRVARRFKIIRFDAAMTLAKKHYQRLWYPQPGGGAGVPSRAEHAMSREEFDRVFPVEFWREVVDRVSAEVPDTLLLAEAFWLMEGYFVRTLGMHRVYNSAFMNMLKNEENGKYRGVLKNILDFNHEILKRFVNFMSNPDEATAAEQFGTGDKYFGVAVMLVTMPGLPMFGHGQVEGFREKYGMEYRKAYWDETVDEALLHHHENQIFPLMRRRHLFSGSQNFVLYDFYSGGHVNEDVFAYSNGSGAEKALVIYNNRYAESGGWLSSSVPKKIRDADGRESVSRPTLGEALGINAAHGYFYRFRDVRTGLDYLRRGHDLIESGLYLHLGPYQYHVFLDFGEIRDEDGCWEQLCSRLNGQGAPGLDHEVKKIRYADIIEAFGKILSPPVLETFGRMPGTAVQTWDSLKDWALLKAALERFFTVATAKSGALETAEEAVAGILGDVQAATELATVKSRIKAEREALAAFRKGMPSRRQAATTQRTAGFFRIFLPWLVMRRLGEPQSAADWLEEFQLSQALHHLLQDPAFDAFGLSPAEAAGNALLATILTRHQDLGRAGEPLRQGFIRLLEDPRVQDFLGFNWYGGVQWFNRERLETLTYWLFFTACVRAVARFPEDRSGLLRHVAELNRYFEDCRQKADQSHYRLDKFRKIL